MTTSKIARKPRQEKKEMPPAAGARGAAAKQQPRSRKSAAGAAPPAASEPRPVIAPTAASEVSPAAKITGRKRAATGSVDAGAPIAGAVAVAARSGRRAIFIDVENTSSEETLMDVIEGLKIDRRVERVDFTAVGNWRTIGQRLGRKLASLGAQLVHSAPATGVRDWSDLWIAVAAGCWLGKAEPGDVLEIVSNDRAFDAVGDAAAARGVVFHRLQHRRGAVVPVGVDEEKPAHRTGGGRRRRGPAGEGAGARRPVVAPAAKSRESIEPHGATRDQMLAVIARLGAGDRWVNLDVLERTLKAEGFARPPGSLRLVTRLRMLREVEVDSHGRVRLSSAAATAEVPDAVVVEAAPEEGEAAAPPPPRRRRRRRGKSPGSGAGAAADEAAVGPAAP